MTIVQVIVLCLVFAVLVLPTWFFFSRELFGTDEYKITKKTTEDGTSYIIYNQIKIWKLKYWFAIDDEYDDLASAKSRVNRELSYKTEDVLVIKPKEKEKT